MSSTPNSEDKPQLGVWSGPGLTMFLGIRDAKQGAKPWGAEGALVVGATQLSCAKTDKANQIAVSREQGLRVFCQTSGFDNERSNTVLFLTSSDRSAMPGAVSSCYGPGNGSRPNAFWPKLLDPVNVPVCPLVTSHMSKDKENSKPDKFCTCLFDFNKRNHIIARNSEKTGSPNLPMTKWGSPKTCWLDHLRHFYNWPSEIFSDVSLRSTRLMNQKIGH